MTHHKFRISVIPGRNIFHRGLPTESLKLRRTAIECNGTSYVFSGTNVTLLCGQKKKNIYKNVLHVEMV